MLLSIFLCTSALKLTLDHELRFGDVDPLPPGCEAGKTVQNNAPCHDPQDLQNIFVEIDKLAQTNPYLTDNGMHIEQHFLEGHSGKNAVETRAFTEVAKKARDEGLKTYCETGFNMGHSATRFMYYLQGTGYSFDIGRHDYSHSIASYLQESVFGNRLTTIWGDSLIAVPNFFKENPDVRCDVILVDGGHSYEQAMSDLFYFSRAASPTNVIIVDDAPSVHEGVVRAYTEFRDSGCLVESYQWRDNLEVEKHILGFSVGQLDLTKCGTEALKEKIPFLQTLS